MFIKVITVTHSEGDEKEFTKPEDAVLYANNLVERGFSLYITKYNQGNWEEISFEDLLEIALTPYFD